jgi:hypothetical protein
MWHGDPGSRRQRINWARLRAEIDRFVQEHRTRRTPDNDAARFTENLEQAVVDLQAGADFAHATRKNDHVEELRQVLGILLDILADWETLARPQGLGRGDRFE